jgi:putative endonuclease
VASGAEAERLAEDYLQRRGLALVERNYRCRYGEIDLIMRDSASLVFVEVRLRSRGDFGGAAASIGADKQGRLVRAAQHYLSTLRRTPPCRFDALLLRSMDEAAIEWVKNAFGT